MEHAREQTHVSGHHSWIRSRFDLVVVALLGVTVMAIAWGAYKAEVAAKDADHYFNRSAETLSTAHKLDLRAAAIVAAYEQMFLELERDRAEGRTKTIPRLRRSLFTPAFLAEVRWWERQPPASRPVSPFSGSNPRYRNVFSGSSERARREGDRVSRARPPRREPGNRLHGRDRHPHGCPLPVRDHDAAQSTRRPVRPRRHRHPDRARVDRALRRPERVRRKRGGVLSARPPARDHRLERM